MDETDRIRRAYDKIAYDSFPYRAAHPDRMGVVGLLGGVECASAKHCQVLELGCAAAGNLIPMAMALPESEFVGVDLSPRQIEQGAALVKTLGLRNIQLHAMSITDFPEQQGEFDYIIAHGMYSWVPEEVREKLMEICCRYLAPRGVCFISFKTFPGWHMNNVLRDLMLFHAREASGEKPQAAMARQMLEFVTAAFDNTAPQSSLVKQMAVNLLKMPEMFLSHDHLSPVSHPVLFRDFASHAKSHGLRYVGHADPASDFLWRMPPAWQQKIADWSGSIIEREQYVDFLCWRSIRTNILCREDSPSRTPGDHQALQSMHVAGRPQESVLEGASAGVKFSIGDLAVTATDAAVIDSFRRITLAWPGSVSFAELVGQVPATLRGDESTLRLRLADHILAGYRCRLLELWARPVDFAGRPQTNAKPRTTPLMRWQAEHLTNATTLRHELFAMSEPARRLLRLLDGTRSVAELHRLMSDSVQPHEVDRLLQSFGDESLLLA